MIKRDHYAVLGVAPEATAETSVTPTAAVAMWHPDRNAHSAATARCQALNAAYECLKDPLRRAAYDRARHRCALSLAATEGSAGV